VPIVVQMQKHLGNLWWWGRELRMIETAWWIASDRNSEWAIKYDR
jgi:hypothetical protein